MATIQLGTTGSASQLCNYAEKRAVEKDGHNLDIEYAKSQMNQTRELFSKNDGIQAHHVIQSFKPDEVTPEKANQVGLELAEKLAPGHEDRKSTRLKSSHVSISYAVFCLKKKKKQTNDVEKETRRMKNRSRAGVIVSSSEKGCAGQR